MTKCGKCIPVRGIVLAVVCSIRKKDCGGETLILFLLIKNRMVRIVFGVEVMDGCIPL